MENATKALLIAAAVLIAIILISLGLAVVRQGQEAVQDADLSEAEATQFNSKFTMYDGSNVSTSRVNALYNAVFSHNNQERAAGTNNFVIIKDTSTTVSADVKDLAKDATKVPKKGGSAYYKVQCFYNNGIVDGISITSTTGTPTDPTP